MGFGRHPFPAIRNFCAAFAWICLALLYPVIGGLPIRRWPLPIAILLIVYAIGSLSWDGDASALTTSLLSIVLQLVREAIEDCAPPGSVRFGEYMPPEPWLEAEALVRGIYAIACGRADE